ncbi:hypothetical protein DPEC_G00166530 [Dallia pectoralis]|uniref:Uncharacterized protein n=1 Tax=Dallia pectoralis TaxID=75939 RepID=A0ACC2GI14_DALPE|nr:hypothetical protein DPEC_G00166530 [Dallia pectoralis]
MARAKAEAAKARLPYAKKEMSLKLEKAKLEATIDMLSLEKETAAAVAEAEVLEAAVDGSDRSSCKLQLEATPLDPIQRTRKYIAEQANEQNEKQFAPAPQVLSQDESRRLHTEPAIVCPIQTPHLKAESAPPDADLRSTAPNRVTVRNPQLTPDMPDHNGTYGPPWTGTVDKGAMPPYRAWRGARLYSILRSHNSMHRGLWRRSE